MNWFSLDWVTTDNMILVSFALAALVFVYRKIRKRTDRKRREKVERAELVGIYLSTFMTNVVLRAGISIPVAGIITYTLFFFDHTIGGNILPAWSTVALWVLLAALFMLNDKEKLVVPNAYVAILTIFGTRFNVYFEEGEHPWNGKKFLGIIGWSKEPLLNRKDYPGEEKGFVYIGDRVVTIWPDRKAKGEVIHEIVSGDGSTVRVSFTDTFKTCWPLQWANNNDPILDIAERSRSGIRTVSSFIPGFDNVKLKSIYTGLMGGETLVVGMTTKQIDIFDRGSVVQDRTGRPIFEMVPYVASETKEKREKRVEKVKEKIARRILSEGDRDMLKVALGEDGQPFIQTFHLDEHLVPVLVDCGSHLERCTASTLNLSKKVEEEANNASAESFQRRGQRMNAEAMRESGETMRAGLAKEGGEAALAAALAADGKAEYVHVSGADRLTRAAVAGAKSFGGKKK